MYLQKQPAHFASKSVCQNQPLQYLGDLLRRVEDSSQSCSSFATPGDAVINSGLERTFLTSYNFLAATLGGCAFGPDQKVDRESRGDGLTRTTEYNTIHARMYKLPLNG